MRYSITYKGRKLINLSAYRIEAVLPGGRTVSIPPVTGIRGKLACQRPDVFYVTASADLLARKDRSDLFWFDAVISVLGLPSVSVFHDLDGKTSTIATYSA